MKKVIILGRARTTNPQLTGDGNEVQPMFDTLGRLVTTPYHVRDLVATASASLTNGSPTSLLAGVTAVFHDLTELTCANQSDAAITVSLLDDGTTVRTFEIPANDTKVFTFPVPLPQSAVNSIWEVDMEDVTNTTVEVAGTFIKNL